MIYQPPTPQPNNVGAYRFTYPATPDNTSPTYTPWPTRVLAALIDGAAVLVVAVATIAAQHHYIAVGPRRTRCAAHAVNAPTPYACHSSLPISGPTIYLIAGIAVLAYVVWNYGYRQGTTGSSLGKSVVGFKVINEHTGQPLGIVASTVRQAAHLLDALPGCAGYLLPPWDVRRRTLADK